MVELVSRYSLLRCVLLLGLVLSGIVRADELPDPTQPLTTASAANSTQTTASQLPVLQSIIYGSKQRKAVLDGHACHEGTRVGRYRVQAIYADRVVVEADGVRHTLRLFSHKVRYE